MHLPGASGRGKSELPASLSRWYEQAHDRGRHNHRRLLTNEEEPPMTDAIANECRHGKPDRRQHQTAEHVSEIGAVSTSETLGVSTCEGWSESHTTSWNCSETTTRGISTNKEDPQ